MNTDFRISVDFWQHPKTKKLIRRTGLEGVRSLQILWSWAAGNRSNGSLSGMDDEDIELAADWNGENGAFVKALHELRWIDNTESGYVLHDWQEHNPWAADAEARGDKARLSRLRQVNPTAYQQCVAEGKTAISQREYEELKNNSGERRRNAGETPTNASASPAPSPSLKPQALNKNPPLSPTEICPPTGGRSPSPKSKKSPARFQQPTPDEVQAYCDERGNGISGQAFVDYYAAQGWKLANGRPLKDWQAAVRTWERHEDGRRQSAATVPRATTVAQQRSLERQYMAQMLLDDREQQKLEEARNAQGNRLIANSDGAQSSFPPGW